MSELKLPAASGGGSISIKGPSSSGSDVDLLDTSGNLKLLDGQEIRFGTDNDLALSHDGSNSYLINKTGSFHLYPKAGEAGLVSVPDGTTKIYYDGSKKLETKSTGIGITSGQRECNLTLQNDALTWKIVNYDYGNNGTDHLGFHDGTSDRLIIHDTGDGISFNGDTAAANCLGDYEEGTYNPTWSGITNYTSGYNTWHYTKIGRLVNIVGQLRCKTTQNDGTDVSFTLPFTPAAQTNAGNTGNFSIGPTMHYNVETGSNGLVTYAYGGNAYGYFYNNQEDSSWWIMESQHIAFDESIYVNFTYIT
jgi:hypothetical protein